MVLVYVAIGLGGEELTVRLLVVGTVVFSAILLTELDRILSGVTESPAGLGYFTNSGPARRRLR